MAINLAEAYVQLSTRGVSGVQAAIGGIKGALNGLGGAVGFVEQSFGNVFGGMGQLALSAAGIGTGAAVGGMLKLAADAESTQVAFRVLLGDAEDAKQVVTDLTQFAASTPFEMTGISESAKVLLAFGTSQESLLPTMRALGDIAAGTGKPLKELATIYGQIQTKGRLMEGELLQLQEAGIPIIDELARKFGVGKSEIAEMVEEGRIGFSDVQIALSNMTTEGGRFNGMASQQSQTLSGLFSTLSDTVMTFAAEAGTALADGLDLKEIMTNAIGWVEEFRMTALPIIQDWAVAIGETFHGAVILLREAWNGWLGDAASQLGFFIDNAGLFWLIWVEQAKIGLGNVMEQLRTWGINFGEILLWIGGNWKDIFFTAADYAMTIMINLGTSLRTLFSNVMQAIRGEINFSDILQGVGTDLTKGAISTIKKMPQLTQAQLTEMTPELERLYQELGRKGAEAEAAALAQAEKDRNAPRKPEAPAEPLARFADPTKDTKAKKDRKGTEERAATFGFDALAQRITEAALGRKDKTEENQKELIHQAKEANGHLKTLKKGPLADSDEGLPTEKPIADADTNSDAEGTEGRTTLSAIHGNALSGLPTPAVVAQQNAHNGADKIGANAAQVALNQVAGTDLGITNAHLQAIRTASESLLTLLGRQGVKLAGPALSVLG